MQHQEGFSGGGGTVDHRLALVHEMSAHNFDLIRFASYRTAMKLRFIQKKVSCKLSCVSRCFRLHTSEMIRYRSVECLYHGFFYDCTLKWLEIYLFKTYCIILKDIFYLFKRHIVLYLKRKFEMCFCFNLMRIFVLKCTLWTFGT